jgi:hypothetical protein
MKCPRDNCKNEADISPIFGVLPCVECQRKDEKFKIHKSPEFYSISRMHRVQAQRDKHLGDMLQPYEKGKANVDFFKRYPEQVKKYKVRRELEKAV